MATFRRRNDKWQVQIRRNGCSPITKTFILKSDADVWARQMEVDLDRQSIPAGKQLLARTTLSALLKRYLIEITPQKRAQANERYMLESMMRLDIGLLQLIQIVPQVIANYRDKRLQEVRPASVRRELDLLGHVFTVAYKQWLLPIPVNPVAVIKKPSPPEPRKRRLSKDEYAKLIKVCGEHKNRSMATLVLFAMETGMRRGEITALEWKNINLQKRTAYLPMTKNGSSRTVPLTPKALGILKSLSSSQEDGSVFRQTNDAVRQAWERMRCKADIPDVHFHDLRHEAISRFFEFGLSVPEVALISGHKDMRMLFRYTHLKAENVAEKLARRTV